MRAYVALAWLLVCGGCSGHHQPNHSGPVYARASAQITTIRPRQTVDSNADLANDPNSVTSWWPIDGTATFRTTGEGVDVALALKNCRGAYGYPVRVYASATCSDLQTGSEPWDGARGVLTTNGLCLGASGVHLFESRLSSDKKPWTLGGPASTNLIGHTIAVLDPDTHEPLACGKIEVADGGALAQPLDPAQQPSDAVLAEVAGSCLLSRLPGRADAGVACPDPKKLGQCVLVHCVASCLELCAEYIACLETHPQCSGACSQGDACNKCLDGGQCALGYCRKQLSCAPPPTPNGPCSEFRACCDRQGPLAASCHEYASQLEDLSGDMSCLGALSDWDVNTNFTYRSPCYPDGGAPPSE